MNPLHETLRAFPIACFSLTLLTDIAYVQTSNLLWLHFSEWLLFAGLVVGVFALVAHLVSSLFGRARFGWAGFIGGIVVMLLAAVNSFIHTADGWTAVVPYGLALSALTIIAMAATGLLARRGLHRV